MDDAYGESLDRVAQHLFESADKNPVAAEAMLRSAVGRAYYSAFWSARDFAHEAGANVTVHQPHKAVCDFFCGSADTELCSIGQDLYRLKRARADADYTDGYSPARQEVLMQIVRARTVRQRLTKKRAAQ